ncbi:hypothetical protein Glove_242g5 [Diversispora epigaea]|uniref:von Willebrand factor A domain-containing protein 8 n=1 Tax=Diversispora epigaea TaxID=1348612 RepID=A0A397ICC1_9GLOM|nr:hypothetical protein Glove_242g5 [Diversispora epigaea]
MTKVLPYSSLFELISKDLIRIIYIVVCYYSAEKKRRNFVGVNIPSAARKSDQIKIMQKDKLGQDVFLIGPPGNLRRGIVLKYAQLTNREIEYVPLSKDCTDADLKQRREILNGTAFYVDQACVRAAIKGRILILDGIEKAERNVLPILNNLLENREMALEDGRFLVHPKRYDSLIKTNEKTNMDEWKLVKVSDRFIVMALGLPIPPYIGHPLDPPLRSRFQCRDIKSPGFNDQVKHLSKLAPKANIEILERLVSVGNVIGSMQFDNSGGIEIPEFPISMESSVLILQYFPDIQPRFLLDLLYPWPLLSTCDSEQRNVIEEIYHRFGMLGHENTTESEDKDSVQCMPGYLVTNIQTSNDDMIETTTFNEFSINKINKIELDFQTVSDTTKNHIFHVFGGSDVLSSDEFFVETNYHQNIFNAMLIAHSVGDFCLIGMKGVGKSALVRYFARKLGYNIEYIPLYKDMSARDLLQRRGTTFSGDTIWENSLLVKAAITGNLAIIDGIETLSFGTLVTIQRLIKEREIVLPDGKQLINYMRYQRLIQNYGFTENQLKSKGILAIHPAFRIVALARPFNSSEGKSGSWLSPEIVSMFQFLVVRPLNNQEEAQVLETLSPGIDSENLSLLLRFANRLRNDTDETIKSLSNALSTRQLIRICRRLTLFPRESLYEAIHKVSLSRFLPSLAKEALEELMINNGISSPSNPININQLQIEILPSRDNPKILRIGDVEQPISKESNPLLIPNVLFHENPQQTYILMQILQDYQLGEHLLLIGNQGVGKNKLADYFLQLLRLPREYIQLHRDTTVQSLTAIPSIVDGVLQFEDSPLVKAVRNGYILVVDEADKAPTYVTAVLRNLLEDGQMVLSDGRRIISNLSFNKNPEEKEKDECIVIHRNFRMIVLANRPGFPFLGNDFYREIGDVFSCHAVDNPDSDSEMFLLKKYAPDVSEDLLLRLTAVFNDLRKLVDEGLISYPYSTRELVNVVKHMQQFPDEGISRILQNVFDFDQYDKDSKDLLIATFQKHEIPVGLESDFTVNLGTSITLSDPVLSEYWTKSNNISENKICDVKKEILALRGRWEIQVGRPRELDRVEGRTVTFTEQVYNFRIPTRGEALDIVGLEDGSLLAVTTNPVALHSIDKEHQKILSIDLYEYFPLQEAPPRIKISIIKLPNEQNDELWNLILHNSSDNSLLSIDFATKKVINTTSAFIQKILLTGLSPAKSIMVNNFDYMGILVFYQYERSTIVMIDFNSSTQYTINVSIKIAQLYLLKPDIWLLRDCLEGQYYIIHAIPNENYQIRVPNILQKIDVHGLFKDIPEEITYLSSSGVFARPNNDILSVRFLQNKNDSMAVSLITNLPEAIININNNPNDKYKVEIYSYIRDHVDERNFHSKYLKNVSLFLSRTGQLATIVPLKDGRSEGYLELFNPIQNTLWRIVMPLAFHGSGDVVKKSNSGLATTTIGQQFEKDAATLLELPNGNLLTMDNSGIVRVWQVEPGQLIKAANIWRKLVGNIDQRFLSIIYEDFEDKTTQETAVESVNGILGTDNGFGSGDNNADGGEGDGEGPGGGGGGNPMNLDGRKPTFIDVSNLQIRTEASPPPKLTDIQREIHEMTMQKKLEQVNMTQSDSELYHSYLINVQREIRELRVILGSIEAKNKERIWLKNQSSGDVDDTKLIEGLTGDINIYKRRGENDDEIEFFQSKPKKMFFVFDLSASMYRFNSYDRRLDRSMEVALMIMESFKSFEHKFQYRIIGHSGDTPNVEFVKEDNYPRTEKEMFKVLTQMYTHSQFCLSGDNTLNATIQAIKEITKEDADDYFVVVLSDANITQYRINPEDIAKVLKSTEKVNSFMIFIGSLQDQAEKLKSNLGSHAHVCMDNKDLPQVMKSIFLASMLKG